MIAELFAGATLCLVIVIGLMVLSWVIWLYASLNIYCDADEVDGLTLADDEDDVCCTQFSQPMREWTEKVNGV